MKRIMLCMLLAMILLLPGLCTRAESAEDTLVEEVVEARLLTYGDTGDDVKELQTHLAEMGYYSGSITGKYLDATRAAIKEFQADFGLETTGVADSGTQSVLFAATYRPLRYGSSGIDVKRLQTRLTQLGYYAGKLSGNYLDATSAAVGEFQKKMGLESTGIADINTQTVLFSSDARSSSSSSLKPGTTPEPETAYVVGNADSDEDIDTQEAENTPAPTVKFKKQLAYKSTGAQVKKLQQRLVDLGYYAGPVSGNYLKKTKAAVKEFQTQNGLKADGICGEDTWNAIFNQENVVLPEHTARPTATPTPVPFYIVVDVTNQAVIVYGRDAEGEYTEVVKEMKCSTGTKKNPTPVGDWVLTGRKTKWCYFPKWGDYARYWTRINSSVAFHSVLYASVDTMSLSVKSYKMLGQRASHGCVRLTVADAKWIYDNIPAGVTVHVTTDLPADPELVASLKLPSLNEKTMTPRATEQPTAEPVYVSGAMPPLPLTKLSKKDSGESVYWLQRKLKELGYYKGKCSGTYLDGTFNAVKAFQKANGLQANGVADKKTLECLYAQELATPGPTPEPTPVPPTLEPAVIETIFSEETEVPAA